MRDANASDVPELSSRRYACQIGALPFAVGDTAVHVLPLPPHTVPAFW